MSHMRMEQGARTSFRALVQFQGRVSSVKYTPTMGVNEFVARAKTYWSALNPMDTSDCELWDYLGQKVNLSTDLSSLLLNGDDGNGVLTLTCPRLEEVPRVIHGRELKDPYNWLQEQSPRTMAFLKAENDKVSAWARSTADGKLSVSTAERLLLSLENEMLLQREDALNNNSLYLWSHPTGSDYPKLLKRESEGVFKTILDLALFTSEDLEPGGAIQNVGFVAPSPDSSLLALSIDLTGDEVFSLVIVQVESGAKLPLGPISAADSFAWARDSSTFFYVGRDEASGRCDQVLRRTIRRRLPSPVRAVSTSGRNGLGSPVRVGPTMIERVVEEFGGPPDLLKLSPLQASKPQVVFREPDRAFEVTLSATSDDQFILIESRSSERAKVWAVSQHIPFVAPRLLLDTEPGHAVADVESFQGGWLVLTNRLSPESSVDLILPSEDDNAPQAPSAFLHPVPGFHMMSMIVKPAFVAVLGLRRMAPVLLLIHHATASSHEIEWPIPGVLWVERMTTVMGGSQENDDSIAFHLQSPAMPPQSWLLGLRERKWTELHAPVLPTLNAHPGQAETIWIPSRDGKTEIPVTLLSPATRKDDSSTGPLYVTGYGAYGALNEPKFSVFNAAVMMGGFSVAIAHVRGGGELGRDWYLQARGLKKTTTFDDVEDVVKGLHAMGIGTPEKTVLMGRSAGGMLAAATVTRAPHLFAGALVKVPCTDLLNSMLEDSHPLSSMEYCEWGKPLENVEDFDNIYSYTPCYWPLSPEKRPALYVTAGLNDTRVTYWEPAKWVAGMREVEAASNVTGKPLLFETAMNSGHFAPVSVRHRSQSLAKELKFVMDLGGVKDSTISDLAAPLLKKVVVVAPDPSFRDSDFVTAWTSTDRKEYEDVKAALMSLRNVQELVWLENHETLLADLQREKPDLAINFCMEGFRNDAAFEMHIPALLDTCGVPYTGTGPRGIVFTMHKHVSHSLCSAIGVPVPWERVMSVGAAIPSADEAPYPLIAKLADASSSVGILPNCVAENPAEASLALARLRDAHPDYTPMLQEYLPGREVSVGFVGNADVGDLVIFPPVETDYSALNGKELPVMGEAHRNDNDAEFWKIVVDKRADLTAAELHSLEDMVRRVALACECRDYGRFDFRQNSHGDWRIIDVNVNNWIGGKFVQMAGWVGMDLSQLLVTIMRIALRRSAAKDQG